MGRAVSARYPFDFLNSASLKTEIMTLKCGCSEEMARVSFFNSAIIPPSRNPFWSASSLSPSVDWVCGGEGGGVGIEEGVVIWGGDQGGVGMVGYQ